MYQSVFVIAEEKNECIIATEVSPYCLRMTIRGVRKYRYNEIVSQC